jgi:hypothetical protein
MAQTAAPSAPAASASAPAAGAPAAKAARPARGADMTRDEYVQRAVDRARRAAEARFDRLDANHDGILTADERRAARGSRRGGAPAQ